MRSCLTLLFFSFLVRGEFSDQQVIMCLLLLTSMEESGVDGLFEAAPTCVEKAAAEIPVTQMEYNRQWNPSYMP